MITWAENAEPEKVVTKDFDQFINSSLYIMFFSYTESKLRILDNVIINNRNDGKVKDQEIYTTFNEISNEIKFEHE